MAHEQNAPIVLVSADAANPQVQELARILHERGSFTLVTSASAIDASTAEAVVVILLPLTAQSATIQAAVQSRAKVLIPVVAQGVQVPSGPWSTPPILLGSDISQLRQTADRIISNVAHASPSASAATGYRTTTAVPSKRKRYVRPALFTCSGLLATCLVIAVVGGLLIRFGLLFPAHHVGDTISFGGIDATLVSVTVIPDGSMVNGYRNQTPIVADPGNITISAYLRFMNHGNLGCKTTIGTQVTGCGCNVQSGDFYVHTSSGDIDWGEGGTLYPGAIDVGDTAEGTLLLQVPPHDSGAVLVWKSCFNADNSFKWNLGLS